MKILLVSPFDFTYPGGVNEHILHLDREFRALGHQTRILSPRDSEEGEEDDGHFYKLGMAVPVPSNGSTARITLSPLISGKVKEFLQREEFDVIHLHEPLAPTLPLMVLLHSKAVNVGTFHAARASNFGYLSGKPLLSFFHGKLHARIAVSPSAKEFVSQYFPDNYQVIPNGISIDRFGPHVPPIPNLPEGRRTILFVGRYNESRKGLKYLLRALDLVRQEFPDVHLLVVGPGQPWRFDRLIERYALDNVTFVGAVSQEELPSYYASCSVFCAPSTGRESFGIVLLEAMASGKPVVATNIPGYTAVVRHRVEGLLVERKNPEALAMSLVHVLADRQLARRLAQAGRRRAEEFAWPVVAKRVLAVYERALAENRGARPTRHDASVFMTRR